MLLKTFINKLNLNFFPIKLFFLLGTFVPYILSSTKITFENGYNDSHEALYKNSFKIDFTNVQENYVHIIVQTETDNNQILSYGTDENCINNRQLLSMNPDSKAKIELFLTKSQIKSNSENNYLCVECINEDKCKFKISMTSEKFCELDLGNQYTYYVYSELNNEMIFNIKNSNSKKSEENIITIWAKGSQLALNVELNVNSEQKNFGPGKIFSFIESKTNSSNYELKISKAETGDLITIGSTIENKSKHLTISPNTYEIMGYLKKGFKEKQFFTIKKEKQTKDDETSVYFLTGLIYEKYAKLELTYNINGNSFIQYKFVDGNIKFTTLKNDVSENLIFFITFNSETANTTDELVFTLQVEDNNNLPAVPIHHPQKLGTIYSRNSLPGQLTTYSSVQSPLLISKINYNMKSVVGFPDMLFAICETYPKCNNININDPSIINPRHLNSMTLSSLNIFGNNPYSPISASQPLLLVNCTDGSQIKTNTTSDSKPKSNFCEFETSIFSNEDFLTLMKTNPYSSFIKKDEKDYYKIELEGEYNVNKIYLDLFLYTGDVNFTELFAIIQNDKDLKVNKYNLANKIFYSITLKNNTLKNIYFSIAATKNSFYTVSYQLVKNSEKYSAETNIVEQGASYLQSIDLSWDQKIKHIKLQNIRTNLDSPFLTNFYSLNCKFNVKRFSSDDNQVNKSVLITDNFGQDILTNEDIEYYKEYFEYTIEAVNNDASEYNKKLCMIYVTGTEIENTTTGMEREISIPENVPQQIVFEKNITKIKYAYQLTDLTDSVIITFNLIDKAPYKLNIYFGYHLSDLTKKPIEFAKNSQYFLSSVNWDNHCPPNQICSIVLEITLNRTEMKDKNLDPKLETIIRQTNSGPTYLPKNELKREILNGNYFRYFYTDIGNDEEGDITVNYKRGSGKIYAKIVKRNQDKIDDDANWRGTYKFPNTIEESLPYDTYLKKINFDHFSTQKCDDGCYLLISIESSVKRSKEDLLAGQPFSIMTRIHKINTTSINYPKVKIEINEYVIGNIASNIDNNIIEFYDIWIPYDADKVIFDWQSDRASLFINVGDEKPSANNSHFSYKSVGHDTIFTLTKKEILGKVNVTSIKNVHLVIGIWADKGDSIYTSIYALKVHLAKDKFDVYHVRSDQKVLCKPVKINDGKYRCLYAVIFDGIDTISSLSVLPRSQSANAHVHSYADFLDQDYFEKNDVEYLEKNIPKNDNCKYKSDTAGIPYIYVDRAIYSKSLYISVISDNDEVIELLSGTSSLTLEITPNPSTVQLFSTTSNLTLNFMTTQDLLINVVSVNGEGVAYWENEGGWYYTIHGVDDRLTLTSGKYDNKQSSNKLIFENIMEINDKNPAFIFYITYYPRTTTYNCDQLKIGKSTEFNYRQADFPINFIVPLKNLNTEIYSSLNFYSFEADKLRDIWYNDEPMLKIWGKIITEEEAYKARLSDYFKPNNNNSINGTFDIGINVASLSFSKNDLSKYNNFNNFNNTNPYLFFSVEKNNNTNINFSKISAEVTVLQENGTVPATEKVYQFGRIGNDENNNSISSVYILNVNKNKPYMRIQFSANSEFVDWCVSKKNSPCNETLLGDVSNATFNGKVFYTFHIPNDTDNELYLRIQSKNNKTIDENLGNYVFKYMNSISKDKYSDYKVEDDKIKLYINKNVNNSVDYRVTIKAVPNSDKFKISYILKAVYYDTYIDKESMQTCAITNSKGYSVQIDYPKIDENDNSVSFALNNITKKIKYISVIAKIQDRSINEYVVYSPNLITEEKYNDVNSAHVSFWVFIIAGSALLVIVIILVVIICYFKLKNKDLEEKVNKISFATDNNDVDQIGESNLLLDDQENRLE